MAKMSADQVESAVRAMVAAEAHRGPDDEGVVVFDTAGSAIGLGNRRLAIQDLSPLGHQPMCNPDTRDLLAYNGEIYNAPELRQQLEVEGFRFRGHSDTEVLMRAYELWGVGCLERLRGMFAFALWDDRRARLLVARDHVGMKPLYYAVHEDHWFVCASEVQAVMASGLISPTINHRALGGYLAYGAVQEPLTIYENVVALRQGSWREFDTTGRVTAEDRFWRIPAVSVHSVNSQIEEGRILLKTAVHRHLLSDVRVGIFLSSGLDSTAILGMAHTATSDHLHAFTVSFPDAPSYDEAAIARKTAARLGVQYHEYPVEDHTALEWIQEGLDSMDQPSMDGFNTHIVARAVKEQGIAVALSGMGGDEIFGGYPSFRRVPFLHRWLSGLNFLPPHWRVHAARILTVMSSETVRQKSIDIAQLGPQLAGLYFQTRRLISDSALGKLGLDWRSLGLQHDWQTASTDLSECLVPGDPVASVSRLETIYYLGNMLLRDSDVFGMANSLEIRVPFLDRDLLDWAFRLPGDVLLPPRAAPKHLLRELCAHLFSKSQFTQQKRGFTLPIGNWLLGPLRDLMDTSLTTLKNSGLLHPQGVNDIGSNFLLEPRSPAWSRAWALVTLGHWLMLHRKRAPNVGAATASASSVVPRGSA